MSVAELIEFYTNAGPNMFKRAQLLVRLLFRTYKPCHLQLKLKQVLGDTTLLGSDKLNTLLLIVLRNAGTDSPWPLTNNPLAKYNDRGRADCNLLLPLWRLVRVRRPHLAISRRKASVLASICSNSSMAA